MPPVVLQNTPEGVYAIDLDPEAVRPVLTRRIREEMALTPSPGSRNYLDHLTELLDRMLDVDITYDVDDSRRTVILTVYRANRWQPEILDVIRDAVSDALPILLDVEVRDGTPAGQVVGFTAGRVCVLTGPRPIHKAPSEPGPSMWDVINEEDS